MRFCFGLSLFVLALAKTPNPPSIFGYPPEIIIDTTAEGEPLRRTEVTGGVTVGNIDLPGTVNLGSNTAHNVFGTIFATFDRDQDFDICRSVAFAGTLQAPNEQTVFQTLEIITGAVEGECHITITATDSLRLETTQKLVIKVQPAVERDCVLGSVFEPFGDCTTSPIDGEEGVRLSYRTIVVDAVDRPCDRSDPSNVRVMPANESGCPAIDCAFSETEETATECDCDTFTKTFTKVIETQAFNGGAECDEAPTRTETCVDQCPVDCAYSEFGEFSPCSVSCGTGEQTRTREIITLNQNGGEPCTELLTETLECNTRECPIDCVVEFGPFNDCSASCGGGTWTRRQSILVEAANDGEACPLEADLLSETAECNTQVCPLETCKDRCGFLGASRGGVRELEDDSGEDDSEDDSVDEDEGESKQFGLIRRIRRRISFPLRRNSADIPNCSCDALCARAVRGENTCCSDITEECPRIRVLPARTTRRTARRTQDPDCFFRSGPSPACPDISSPGFYKDCVLCEN
jgi:hypothetical protein